MKLQVVHISNNEGHRQAYSDFFTKLLGFQKLTGPVSASNFFTLVLANKLLFATVGSSFYRYLLVCFCRVLLLKPTLVLFLGATEYARRKKLTFNQVLINIWKWLPGQHLFAIVPFSVEPNLADVCNDFIYDPQLWDIIDQKESTTDNEFEGLIPGKRKRKAVLFLGKAKKSKAFQEFSDFVLENKDFLFGIVAGKVLEECRAKAEMLTAEGMMVIDRYISDEELLFLYQKTDLVWCYYQPNYDQSSGVFGRAVQMGKTPIIRRNSLIHRLSEELKIKVYALDFLSKNNYRNIFDEMTKMMLNEQHENGSKLILKEIKELSIVKINKVLKV